MSTKFATPGLLLLLILLFSCSSRPGDKKTGLLSNLFNITDNEDKGIKEIIGFYGGSCEYGIEKNVHLGAENTTTFFIKFSKSADLDSFQRVSELPGSNMAYLFYKNLKEEKSNYHAIRTELHFGNGEKEKFEYTTRELEKVNAKMPVVHKIVSLIRDKSFDSIRNFIWVDTSLYRFDLDQVILNMKNAESEFGNASEFIPYGFKFFESDSGREILHIAGLIIRDKQHNNFSVDFDPNVNDEKIFMLNYKW